MILHSLLAFTLLVQSAARESLDWEELELVAFMNGAMNHFARSLSPSAFHYLNFTAVSKCAHTGHNPYGLAKATLHVPCPVEDAPPSCKSPYEQGLAELIVECQYTGEVPGPTVGRPLGAICYEKAGESTEQDPETMCRRWRYPGSQVPEHLKSVYSRILAYQPTSLELYNDSLPSSSTPPGEWPRNEHERTGFGGIGAQSHLGISSEDQFRFSYGMVKVLIEDSDVFTAIPHFRPKKADINDDYILKKLQTLATGCPHHELVAMVKSRQEYHHGYLKSRFNTDNAWSEGALVHVHDQSGDCFDPYPTQTDAKNRRFRWKELELHVTPSDFAALFIANYK